MHRSADPRRDRVGGAGTRVGELQGIRRSQHEQCNGVVIGPRVVAHRSHAFENYAGRPTVERGDVRSTVSATGFSV